MNYPDRLPPQSLDVERTVLGSMLIDGNAATKALRACDGSCFYSGANRSIFLCMKEMFDQGTPIDIITLADVLRKKDLMETLGNESYLAELAESICISGNIEYYTAILREKAAYRAYSESLYRAAEEAFCGEVAIVSLKERLWTELDRIQIDTGKNLVFSPSWNNRPIYREPILKHNGKKVLSVGNMLVIVSSPGAGKSALCEALGAGSVNPLIDVFGFSLPENCRTYYFDTERNQEDHWLSWYRMTRRAEICDGDLVSVGFELLSLIPSFLEKIRRVESVISTGMYQLVIIDGIADLVESVNDEIACNEMLNNLLALAKQYSVALLTTIHHNPQPGNEKARGWLGSEAMRRAESVFIIKFDRETEVRTITTGFGHGKVRNASGKMECSFAWNDSADMFLSCDSPAKKTGEKSIGRDVALNLMDDKRWSHSDLSKEIMKRCDKSEATAKRWIKELCGIDSIIKNNDGTYQKATKTIENTSWIHD